MEKVYLETSVISYLVAWPSRDVLVAAHQHVTHSWWRARRADFDLYVSRVVVDEASCGDAKASAQRLELLRGLPVLELTPEATALARRLMERNAIPKTSPEDALHIAIAAVHGMDYLLTWNCRHLANAEILRIVVQVCQESGYEAPAICTPEQLIGE